ncbi:hypothetical protein [Tistrella sp.]|mgnify:CR=1 FL=1|uniref:DUF3168 domain-containing protein n=1 Tax=Tistrella mobilis TaxID=171437 RepID=A0A3B9IJU4_9PROT|nr:hypothetical protein [Tistrella sp.]MAD39573.1 hypothetical protein [Tistrella sp.]HAE47587.1 hypothetical protein [Tistrella mobilis]
MIDLVYARLTGATSTFSSIEVVESIEAITKAVQSPSGTLFIAPGPETAEMSRTSGVHRQLVRVDIVTAIIVRIADDVRGAARAQRFAHYKADLEAALAGWQPTPQSEPMNLFASDGGTLSGTVSVYLQTWRTTRYLTV